MRSVEPGKMKNWKLTDVHTEEECRDWSEIDGDVLELILSRLSEVAVIRASAVCTRWSSIARSEKFTQFYVKQVAAGRTWPRFTVEGSKYFFERGRIVRYLPASDSPMVPSFVEAVCYEGAGGLFYFFSGSRETVLYYKLSLVQQEWMVTPEMKYRKHQPIVGVVRTGVDGAYKLVVAGGIGDLEDSDEDLTVEIYDSITMNWKTGSPLPLVFRCCTTSLFMNSAVYDGKFYAYDNHASFCSVLDVSGNRWSTAIEVRRPHGVKQSYLVENSTGLSLVGVQNSGSRDLSCCAWNVDPKSLELKDQTQDTVILNARPAPPPILKRSFDRVFEYFGGALGVSLLLIAYIIVMSYGWFASIRRHLKSLSLSLVSRLPSFETYAAQALTTESREGLKSTWLPWHSRRTESITFHSCHSFQTTTSNRKTEAHDADGRGSLNQVTV